MKPLPSLLFLLLTTTLLAAKPTAGGQVSPDGKQEVNIDLPPDQRLRNVGSKVPPHAGMCVSTSVTHSARWQGLREWYAWRDWCAQFPGGSHPQKNDAQIKQFAREKGIAVPEFIQYEGTDPALIKAALASGRLPAVTYCGRDGVNYNQWVPHMVNVVHWSDEWVAVMDNNGPAERLIWMTPAEFVDRWTDDGNGRRRGWAFVWLTPPPPPPPCN